MERFEDAADCRGTRHPARPGNSASRAGDCAMTTALLTARRLITADRVVEFPRIAIHGDGSIAGIEVGEPDAESQSAGDTTLKAAFFDIHVAGAAGDDAMGEIRRPSWRGS